MRRRAKIKNESLLRTADDILRSAAGGIYNIYTLLLVYTCIYMLVDSRRGYTRAGASVQLQHPGSGDEVTAAPPSYSCSTWAAGTC